MRRPPPTRGQDEQALDQGLGLHAALPLVRHKAEEVLVLTSGGLIWFGVSEIIQYSGMKTIRMNNDALDTGSDASAWIIDLLTFGGKIPFHVATSRLSKWEWLIVHHAIGRSDVLLVADGAEFDGLVAVTQTHGGWLEFWQPGQVIPPESTVIGWLRIPAPVMDMIAEEWRRARDREVMDLAEVDAILRSWEAEKVLDERLAEIADRVERVETVFIHIGRDVFSKSDAGSSTLTRDGLLAGLRKVHYSKWRESDRLFVVLGLCLFASGRSVRFEEFNGRQLSVAGVRDFLLGRYAGYCVSAGIDFGTDQPLGLFELAERVRELQPAADQSPDMRYRRINGLTFVKSEHLMAFPFPRDPSVLPAPVAEYGAALGVQLTGDVRGDMNRITRVAANVDAGLAGLSAPGSQGALGELLAAVVLSAVVATGSDYGMSSSMRNLAGLRGAAPGGIDGVLSLKKGDFFCCCLPHPLRLPAAADGEDVAIVWRAAQRMMYNRWHFAPGEFDRSDIPEKRHYFFPPQVPDIAEHSEKHHGGHVASRVRFTIRAPGAQAWHPPFTVFGHGFRGCYDIRLVRMEGPAFTIGHLIEAVRHCSLVDEFWRTLAVGVESGIFPVRPMQGFDREWYEARTWQQLRPFATAHRAASAGIPLGGAEVLRELIGITF